MTNTQFITSKKTESNTNRFGKYSSLIKNLFYIALSIFFIYELGYGFGKFLVHIGF